MQGVFIGRGWYEGAEVFMPGIWTDYLYYTNDGSLIDPFAGGEGEKYVNPETLAEFNRKEPVHFSPGDLVILPMWDKELLEKIFLSQYFAKPDFQTRIKAWFKSGKSGDEVWEKVRDAGGLLTPEDLGLKASATTATTESVAPVKEGG